MTAEIRYFAKVAEDGTLEGVARGKVRKELQSLFAGQSIEVVIHKKKKHRSIQQNRAYWLYMGILSDHTGYTKDELHSICKGLFLKAEKVNEETGSVFSYTKSTTELSTTEFMDYIAQLQQWAAEEFGVVLPDPNSQIEMELSCAD